MVSQKYNKLCQNFIFQRRESDAFLLYFLSHICVPTEQRKLIFNIRRSSSIRQNRSAILFSKIVHIFIIKKIGKHKRLWDENIYFMFFLLSVLCICTSLRKKTYPYWNNFPRTVHFKRINQDQPVQMFPCFLLVGGV
jgi:hypothetical protein